MKFAKKDQHSCLAVGEILLCRCGKSFCGSAAKEIGGGDCGETSGLGAVGWAWGF